MDLQAIIRSSAELGATIAIERAGLSSGEISKAEATRIYGAFFRDAVAAGRLRPVRVGGAVNSKQYYRVADILALRAADETAAYIIETNQLTK